DAHDLGVERLDLRPLDDGAALPLHPGPDVVDVPEGVRTGDGDRRQKESRGEQRENDFHDRASWGKKSQRIRSALEAERAGVEKRRSCGCLVKYTAWECR